MEIIYKPNILNHRLPDSLYYTLIFQKLCHVIYLIYFRRFYTLIAK